MKFTFRKGEKPTGLGSIGNPYPFTDIKLDRKQVGNIVPPNWRTADNKWAITLRVTAPDLPAEANRSWKNVTLKARFDSEPDARSFIIRNAEKIIAKGLYLLDD